VYNGECVLRVKKESLLSLNDANTHDRRSLRACQRVTHSPIGKPQGLPITKLLYRRERAVVMRGIL